MEKMHDEVHDVREMMVSITVIISTVMLSHIIAKKKQKTKMEGNASSQSALYASFILYDLF